MTEVYDGGIVDAYVDSFLRLGIEHQRGEQVMGRVTRLVSRAMDHIDAWAVGEPGLNKARLVSQLKIHADLAAKTTPAQAKVLRDAHHLAAEILKIGLGVERLQSCPDSNDGAREFRHHPSAAGDSTA